MTQSQGPAIRRVPPANRRQLLLAAALAFFAIWQATAEVRAGEPEFLPVVLLTRDIGDPRAPGNIKLACILHENIAQRAASARAEDFIVYVYPLGFSRAEGMTERYRAGGLFLWRSGQRIFIDARVVPLQDRDGPAEVRVLYAPANEIIAEGVADGVSRFSSDLVDVVLAVDVSGSMAYNDPRRRRVVAARTFIELAREGGGIGRIGLVTFNHLAEATSPLMPLEQSERLLSALSGVSADGMTNLDHALRLSMRELFSVDSKQPVIILLTDGKNEGTRYQNSHLECARNGVRLFTVGLTESADHRLLKEMADSTGGIYFRAPTDRELPEIYAQLAAELGKRQLMYAERLRTPSGQMTLPIDATVKRLAAMVDGGAKLSVFGPGGAQTNGRSMESVYLGRPTAGAWNFSWSQATPNASALALFGDTQFFLDVFPPQLRGGKLAIGATLAQGARALPNAKVWIEPLAGVIAERTELFENGRYGPGVYGAVIDIPETGPDRFDLTLRASGIAWDAGDFVRQAVGLTIRYKDVSPVPEDVASASLEGDLDFGVLFPGEAGTALAKIDLDANEARDLFFELSWDTGFDRWPRLSSNVAVEPGKHSFELQIQIPETAEPGDYRGEFSISDGDAIDDKSLARVKVGTVRFAAPGEIDLGLIPRGTFAVRKIHLLSDADKAAPLEVEFDSNGELALLSELDTLPDGKGEIPLEARVTVPIDKPAGDYFASASIRAGPGWVELPFRWQVEADSASLEGDLDFGVLFPGEIGTALAKIDLYANRVRELFFELSWDTGFDRWPRLSSNIEVEPGKSSFELEIQIPETAAPGDYRGEFFISDEDAIDDKSLARVKVGTVRFAAPGEIDLGLIPRGTFAVQKIHLLYDADKAAPLEVEFDSNGELALLPELGMLPGGKGEIPFEARVTVPIDKPAGDYFASASIRAGPGWVELPFRWRVEAYSIKADTFRPLIGLPPTPELPSLSGSSEQSLPPVDQVDEFFIDAPSGYDQALSYSGDESPWEMTDKIFRERDGIGDRQSDAPSALGLAVPGLRLPEIESPKIAAGDSIWNAWWVYLLAILLLLLLLLLLLAYILYRLGKSALARFLLISTLANLILLAIFIALLSTSLMISPDTRPAISVNLIEDEPQATPGLTEAERVVLIASSQSGTSATGSGVSVEEVFFAGSAAGGNDQQLERAAELPAQVVVEADLAEAAHQTVVPLENRELSALRRRERQLERRESPQPNFEQAEMDEPPPDETGKLNNANPEVDEQRLEFPVEERQEQPAWLDGERPSRLLASSTGLSLGEMPGMEAVGFNAAAGRVEPQDRPRPIREAMFTYPEPRVEIMDPIREAVAWAGDGVNNDSVGGIRARDYESDRDERRFDAAPAAALTIAAGSDRDRQVAFGKAVFADAPAGTASAAEPFQGGGVDGRVLNAHRGHPSGEFRNGQNQQRRGGPPDQGDAGPHGLADVPGNASIPAASDQAGNGLDTGEGRFDGLTDASRAGTGERRVGAAGFGSAPSELGGTGITRAGRHASTLAPSELGGTDLNQGLEAIPLEAGEPNWRRNGHRAVRRSESAGRSSAEIESFLIVVGDIARLPDAAAENLFSALGRRLARGLVVEDRLLSPTDTALSSCLLAILSPGEIGIWSRADLSAVGKYLADGGHIWLDATGPEQAEPAMKRLADASGGTYAYLDPEHQLSEGERIGALTIGGQLAAVVTYQNWRRDWRYGEAKNGRALRFLVRSMNYFLSGDAETGIEIQDPNLAEGLGVDLDEERIPESLSGGAVAGRLWDGFSPESSAAWRMPAWSDPGNISAVSDGMGGRALKLDLVGSSKGRTAIYRVLSPVQDFSRAGRATVDVYYDGLGEASVSMVFTAQEGGEWIDFETPPLELVQGWNHLSLPIRGGSFRSLSGGGGYFSILPGSERIGRTGFFFYRRDASAAVVLFRDLRLYE